MKDSWEVSLDKLLDSQRGKTWLVIRPLLKDFIRSTIQAEKEATEIEITEPLSQLHKKSILSPNQKEKRNDH